MKALVTGGGGFLGRHIVKQLLVRGDEVAVFSRGVYPNLEEIGATVLRGDLQDDEAVNQACTSMDAVFHVAAKVDAWGPWESFYQTNVVGTQNVIDACRKQSVRKLIFTSTPSVVANGQSRSGVDETIPYPAHFEAHYPYTKAIAEQMVVEANGPDLLTVSLRPHIIFGPDDTQLVPRVLARARTGRMIQIGDGNNKVDLTYIDDAAQAHLLAADALEEESPVAGSIYFISQDEPVNLWGWVNELLTQLDIPPIKRRISLRVALVLAHIIEFTHRTFRLNGEPQLVPYVVNEMALDHYFDISRAKQDFGYQPQISMEEAMRRTVAYFRNQ